MSSTRIDLETFISNLQNKNSPIHKFLRAKDLYVFTENMTTKRKKKKPTKIHIKPAIIEEKEKKIFNESENISNFFRNTNNLIKVEEPEEENNKVDTQILLKNSYDKFFEMSKDNMYSFPTEAKKNRRYMNHSLKGDKFNILPPINEKINIIPNKSFDKNINRQNRFYKNKKIQKPKERIYNINRHIPNLNQNNDLKGYLFYEMKDYYIQQRGKIFK
jgi:hypothetical protein